MSIDVKSPTSQPHCWGPALSEPDVTVARHPAQALRKTFPEQKAPRGQIQRFLPLFPNGIRPPIPDAMSRPLSMLLGANVRVGAFNLSLLMRQLFGKGTPRGLQGLSADLLLTYFGLWQAILARLAEKDALERILMLSAQVTISFSPQKD